MNTLLLLAVVATAALAGPIGSGGFTHSAVLDENNKYTLSWTFNDTAIAFEARVQTTGWVGLGISPNGGMAGADIAIGWVDVNGQAFFKDRHGTGFVMPSIDPHQDWFLLSGTQQDGFTVLTFTRLLNTHDCHHDLPITSDTLRLIWAFNDQDPADENSVVYHGIKNKGAKSVNLLEPVQDKSSLIPSSTINFSFLNPSVPVPIEMTTYWCQAFNMPSLTAKSHIIKFGPVIPPESKGVVHHIILYGCYAPVNESLHGVGYTCYTNSMPPELFDCRHPIAVWAVGGDDFYYPDNVGLSIGGPGDPTFAILETHYNNPENKAGIIDNSGLRIWYTSELRQYDAGLVETGAAVATLIVPPQQPAFQVRGICAANCSQDAFPPTGVKAFAYMLHAHQLGRKLQMSHYRGSQFIGELGRDDQYDFNYQQSRLLTEETTIMPGDTIVLDCIYDSTSRPKPTFGGLATHQEMCVSWIYYYPRTEIAFCQSILLPHLALPLLGYDANVTVDYINEDAPNFWVNYFVNATWTPAITNGIQQMQTTVDPLLRCLRTENRPLEANNKFVPYPAFVQNLPDRSQDCLSTAAPASTSDFISPNSSPLRGLAFSPLALIFIHLFVHL